MHRYKVLRTIDRKSEGSTQVLVKGVGIRRRFLVEKISLVNLSQQESSDAESEIQELLRLVHPNLVRFIEAFIEGDVLNLVSDERNESRGNDPGAKNKEGMVC